MNYEDANGEYQGVFQDVQLVGSGGQFIRTAMVKSGNTMRSWRVTCSPARPTSLGGQIWNPTFAPESGAEVQGDRSGLLGRVVWGDGQVQHECVFDWRRGGTFVVHGTYVDVAVSARFQAVGVGPINPLLFVGATIAPAQDSAAGEVVASVHTGSFLEVDAIVPIPGYAKAFRFYQTGSTVATPTNIRVRTQDAAGGTSLRQDGTDLQLCTSGVINAAYSAGGLFQLAGDPRGWWWGIEGTSTQLTIDNLSAFAIAGWVEFLLDIG